jgi:uncharacterized membrane protein
LARLIIIGFSDETVARRAAAEAQRLATSLLIAPEFIGAVVRDARGELHLDFPPLAVKPDQGSGYIDPYSGLRPGLWGAAAAAVLSVVIPAPIAGLSCWLKLAGLEKDAGLPMIDRKFQESVRDVLQPGTSALVIVGDVTSGSDGVHGVVEAMRRYEGTALETELPKNSEQAVDRLMEESARIDVKASGPWLGRSESSNEP